MDTKTANTNKQKVIIDAATLEEIAHMINSLIQEREVTTSDGDPFVLDEKPKTLSRPVSTARSYLRNIAHYPIRRLSGSSILDDSERKKRTLENIHDRLAASFITIEELAALPHIIKDGYRRHLLGAYYSIGLGALPTEIFVKIFEFANDANGVTTFHLSQVCRRFRQIALATPTLWGHISSSGPREWTQMHLDRSGRAPLSITITDSSCHNNGRAPRSNGPSSAQCRCLKVLAQVIEHSQRWCSFHWHHDAPLYDLEAQASDDNAMNAIVKNWSKGLVLPRLQDLTIFSSFYPSHLEFPAVGPEIVRSWNMPALDSLTGDDLIFLLNLTSKLDSVTIRPNYSDPTTWTEAIPLQFFLSPMIISLQELSIDFDRLTMDNSFVNELKLAKVRSLTLTHVHSTVFDSIIAALRVPSLRRMVFSYRSEFQEPFLAFSVIRDLLRWLDSNKCHELQYLHIAINYDRENHMEEELAAQTLDTLTNSYLGAIWHQRGGRPEVRFSLGDHYSMTTREVLWDGARFGSV